MSTVIRIRRCHCGKAHPALQECSHHICNMCGERHERGLCKPEPNTLKWIFIGASIEAAAFGLVVHFMWGSA